MEKNSDKSHGSTGMFPHQFGRFLPLVGHLPSEKSILMDFSSSRVVAVSVPFPEVRIRKGTESGPLNIHTSVVHYNWSWNQICLLYGSHLHRAAEKLSQPYRTEFLLLSYSPLRFLPIQIRSILCVFSTGEPCKDRLILTAIPCRENPNSEHFF